MFCICRQLWQSVLEQETESKLPLMFWSASCIQLWLRGRINVLIFDGFWFDPPGLHAEVSLSKILNPKLLLMCWSCMAVTTTSYGYKYVLNNSVRTLPHRVWTPLQLVITEEASWMRGATSSSNWNTSSCLWLQHFDLPWPGWLYNFDEQLKCVCVRVREGIFSHCHGVGLQDWAMVNVIGNICALPVMTIHNGFSVSFSTSTEYFRYFFHSVHSSWLHRQPQYHYQ